MSYDDVVVSATLPRYRLYLAIVFCLVVRRPNLSCFEFQMSGFTLCVRSAVVRRVIIMNMELMYSLEVKREGHGELMDLFHLDAQAGRTRVFSHLFY